MSCSLVPEQSIYSGLPTQVLQVQGSLEKVENDYEMMRITLEQIKPDPSSVFPATLETDRRCINLDGKDGGTIKETLLWDFGPD